MAWNNILPEVINSIADRVDASNCPAGYLKDKVLWHDGNLYQCQVNIVSDTPWTDTTKLKPVILADLSTDIRKNIAEIEDPSKTYTTGETIWESKTDLKYVDDEGNKQDVNMRSMIDAVVNYLKEYSGLDIKWGWDSTNNLPILKAEKAWDFIKYYDFTTGLRCTHATDVVFYGAIVMKQFQKLTIINSKPDMYSVGIVGTVMTPNGEYGRTWTFETNMSYDNGKDMYFVKDSADDIFVLHQPYEEYSAPQYAQDVNGRSYFYTSGDFTYEENKTMGLAFVTIKKVGGGTISSDEIKDIYESINYNIVPRSAEYTLGNLT